MCAVLGTLSFAGVRDVRASHPPDRPEIQHILVDHSRERAVALGLRFGGYVLNPGGGGAWSSLCPAALGYEDTETYPGVALADGSLVVSLGHAGIARSADALGCGWRAWQPDFPAFFVDLRADPAGAPGLYALSSSPEGALFATQWWTSVDGAASFRAQGQRLVSELAATSLAVTRDASRWYVAGSGTAAALLRSDDAGASWQRSVIEHAGVPRLIGVHSAVEDLVIVLLDGHTHDAVQSATDGIFVSFDGGQLFESLYTGAGDLIAATLSEDGRLAFGGPDDGLWVIDLSRGTRLTRRELPPALSIQALAWAGARLYAGVRDASGALSLLAGEDGNGFVSVVSLCDGLAALACPGDGAPPGCSGESAAQMSLTSEAQPWCAAPPAPESSPAAEPAGCSAGRAPAEDGFGLVAAVLALGSALRRGRRRSRARKPGAARWCRSRSARRLSVAARSPEGW
jgi:hypothetical protein